MNPFHRNEIGIKDPISQAQEKQFPQTLTGNFCENQIQSLLMGLLHQHWNENYTIHLALHLSGKGKQAKYLPSFCLVLFVVIFLFRKFIFHLSTDNYTQGN